MILEAPSCHKHDSTMHGLQKASAEAQQVFSRTGARTLHLQSQFDQKKFAMCKIHFQQTTGRL